MSSGPPSPGTASSGRKSSGASARAEPSAGPGAVAPVLSALLQRLGAARLSLLGGLASLAVASVLAVLGQMLATADHAGPDDGRRWLLAAALLGYIGAVGTEFGLPASAPGGLPHPTALAFSQLVARRRWGGLGLLGLGGLLAGLATRQVDQAATNPLGSPARLAGDALATSLWLLGLAAAVAGALAWSPAPRLGRPSRARPIELALLLGILGVAVWLRVPNLASVPPNVHGDEAAIGLDARAILAGSMPAVFATGWYDVPALSFAIAAAAMRLFGNDLVGLRMASAIQGVLSIAMLYLLARRLWGPRPSLLGAALLALAAWHIHFSRTGFHYMQAVLVMLLVLYTLVRAEQDHRPLDWLLCGICIGLCVEVYYAARITPVIVASYLMYRVVTTRGAFLRAYARGIGLLVFGAGVFLLPMLAVFAHSPTSFGARTAEVLVLSGPNLQHELDAYRVNSLSQVLLIQAQRTLEAFNIRGETSLQYGDPTPLLDPWTGALLVTSTIAVLVRPGSPRGALVALWVWLGLVAGSVLTVDALFSPRVLPVLPALLLGPAVLLDLAWRGVGRLAGRIGSLGFGALVLVLLGAVFEANVHDYFDIQVVDRQPADRFTLLADYAAGLRDQYRLVTIGRADWTLRYETPRFLVPDVDALDIRDGPLTLPLPPNQVPPGRGLAFLVETGAPDYAQRLAAIRQAYPNGQEQTIFERPAQPVFTAYLVPKTSLSL